MLPFLFSLAQSNCSSATNCLQCVDTNGCFYCRDNKTDRCHSVDDSRFRACGDRSSDRDAACVAELGGDAIQRNRYLIGAAFLVAAIAVDLTVRFCSEIEVDQPEQQGGVLAKHDN
jgi:hypothetical protein